MIGVKGKKAKKGVKKVKRKELRHRIKHIPFRKLIRAVEDKAREDGSVVVYVSPYRNSKVCPIHFAPLRDDGDWHTLYCPRGHAVDRDAAAVLNMLWKITPEGAVKGVWWEVKEVRRMLRKGVIPKARWEEESACPVAGHVCRLGFAQVIEGQPPVARNAGPGRLHEPRPRGR
ncbi:MAG: hypothetical protein AT715_06405 [Thermoproteus sp. JCHS_4]|nr:MAG: hypothetical protein AT715_06405 [Thermoproteus sp. JCHS_4]